MEQSQKDFGDVLASMREAGGALDPFRKQLADQIKFLGSDLNPSATASLKPQADKLNADGAAVFSETDQAISKSNAYFAGLKKSQDLRRVRTWSVGCIGAAKFLECERADLRRSELSRTRDHRARGRRTRAG